MNNKIFLRFWPEWMNHDDLIKRALFNDIFTININHHVEIVILPEFQLNNNSLILQDELELDDVFSENDARFSKVFFTNYIITILEEKAGHAEKVNMGNLVKGLSFEFIPTFFYISKKQFLSLVEEVEEFSNETGLFKFMEKTKIEDTLTGTLIDRVINSEFFSSEDLEWIKSGNGAWV